MFWWTDEDTMEWNFNFKAFKPDSFHSKLGGKKRLFV